MEKIFTRSLFFLAFFILFGARQVAAQTLTIHDFANGIYTPGSSIGVPFTINTSSGCISPGNQFQLILSDELGNFTPGTQIGTFNGFYGTFVNGAIPPGTIPGIGYRVMIRSTTPLVSSLPSAPFTIIAGAAVTASLNGARLGGDPQTFGLCQGVANHQYNFINSSTGAATANFFNESALTPGGTVSFASGGSGSFTALRTNYTIIEQTSNGISIGTQAYALVNNLVSNQFGSTSSTTVCLASSGGAMASFNVDISTAVGIQNNFPGNTYRIDWADGNIVTYTLCDIQASGGIVSHTYTSGSCGKGTDPNFLNSYNVVIQPLSPYCTSVISPVKSYVQVLNAPTNSFNSPLIGCTNSTVTFTNTSDPGQDPTKSDCSNPDALYTWYVDGDAKVFDYPINRPFTWPFATRGNHTVTLELQSSATGVCTASNVTHNICIQDPPQPAFTLPTSICKTSSATPTDLSNVDLGCSPTISYLWTVTGPATVTYAGGTSKTSHLPQFKFTKVGAYQVTLTITTATCGPVTSAPQTIYVDDVPAITLSPNASICGKPHTYTFSPTAGVPTKTTVTGMSGAPTDTYVWTVTSSDGGTYAIANGSSATPQITFNDLATYTIGVTITNRCSSANATQTLTFVSAPDVTIDPPATICPVDSVHLVGHVTPLSSVVSIQWLNGTGTFSDRNSLTPAYKPSAAEISADSVVLTLDVKTTLIGSCNEIQVPVTVHIYPVNSGTNAQKTICSGDVVNFNLTSSVPSSTYSWVPVLTSGTATGYTSQTGATINNFITNTGTTDAVVTYTITPHSNGCDGPTFTLAVTINPATVPGTTSAAIPVICSGSTATINLTGQVGTILGWEQSTDNGVTFTGIAGTGGIASYTTPVLTDTTQFRAVVLSGQ
ncbi:MAG: PKD-like domain-containing protein, partial [Mucilaginibacter sp.]